MNKILEYLKKVINTEIIVNGKPQLVRNNIVSYEQIVILAEGNPNYNYSISYYNSDGIKENGILYRGGYCIVKNGTIINCYYTNNS